MCRLVGTLLEQLKQDGAWAQMQNMGKFWKKLCLISEILITKHMYPNFHEKNPHLLMFNQFVYKNNNTRYKKKDLKLIGEFKFSLYVNVNVWPSNRLVTYSGFTLLSLSNGQDRLQQLHDVGFYL